MLTAQLAAEKLPLPTCVVGQTGTLTRMDHNCGRFDRVATAELSAIAAHYGVGFKEHNGDYLSAATCRVHPDLGVTGMNVAPEFGLVETDALLALADLEAKLVRKGWLEASAASNLRELFLQRSFADTPWKKWVTPEIKKLPVEAVQADTSLRLVIARVCGHYTYDMPEVLAARRRLYENVNRFELVEDAEAFVVGRVRTPSSSTSATSGSKALTRCSPAAGAVAPSPLRERVGVRVSASQNSHRHQSAHRA